MKHELIIIGAGASGITAAITAKNFGIDVALIDSNNRIGKKILATGNGRCNISNENISLDRYHSEDIDFFRPVLSSFSINDTLTFFNELGLPLITLDEGKIYPMSLQASSVLDILRETLDEKEIPVYIETKVSSIKHENNYFKIITNTSDVFDCEKLLICCGGKSAANTGSDGSGFTLAKKLGHSIVNPIPALVQLKLGYKKIKALSGVKFDGKAEILVDGKSIKEDFGEILFTDYGISGPPILQLSRTASYALSKGKNTTIKIDMMNNFSSKELQDFLENHWGIFGYRSIHDSFIGIINKKIIPVLLKESGIDNIHKPCWELTWNEKLNIFKLLKEWEFQITGTNGFNNSQVTAGGVNTKEINPLTLESKILKNLYFAGEIIDVDGDCGGFNLQWAWASGFIAAKTIASKNKNR
ncbi:BaiN/RdsA family NAD(P)/FAD-dependent oxidoreductase [Clostridium brassicae]|uniref:NAD(P)/FAD-dependent oxidoreductase n=1 Tax=Clostridium brassicae TaxID=2999072 RepID=A0ABT4D7B3_9CLOT|nr:NAD(P)/FAD-dependent oxidoreductase [Clostridium brassicae]MCY6958160.1 NAD(P)/FAD-dependent oxidoreductase [Clostridium brassicae]